MMKTRNGAFAVKVRCHLSTQRSTIKLNVYILPATCSSKAICNFSHSNDVPFLDETPPVVVEDDGVDDDDAGKGDSNEDGDKTLGPKTTSGEECHFPYKYKNETFESCTHVDHAGPW